MLNMNRREFITLPGGAAIVAGQHPIAIMLDFVNRGQKKAPASLRDRA
jgi:hypothetical protein